MVTLFHIYGPFAIQAYGTMIVLGILLGLFFIKRDKPLMQIMSFDQVLNLTTLIIIFGVIGARLLYLAEHGTDSFHQAFAVWDGGLSVFGAVIANLIMIPLYLNYTKKPIMRVLDRIAIYVPLIHSIARIGCALAGCCYGKPKEYFLSVTYTNPDSLAPLNTPLVPVQLLSAFGLFIIFCGLYYERNIQKNKSGYLFGSYLFLTVLLRLNLDAARAAHHPILFWLSHNQIIAIGIATYGFFLKARALYKSPFKKFNAKDL